MTPTLPDLMSPHDWTDKYRTVIEISGLTKAYAMGDDSVHALRGVSLRIEAGEFVAIMGPSGSGKSTLTQILGLLDAPTAGSYRLNGKEVSKLSDDELAVRRRETIGFVFQQFNLLPRMTALENVALPLLYSRLATGAEARERARALLERVGLGSRAHHRPNELSGGQQQRVAIARALVNSPRVILADEPTGNLDSASEREIMAELAALNDAGITIIVVTHEESVSRRAKRVIRLRDGAIQSDVRIEPGAAASSPRRIPARERDTLPAPAPAPIGAESLAHLRQGLRALAANKFRTMLSTLGILIGVAAVVAMLALGRGAQKAMETNLASLGSNLLVVRTAAVRVDGVTQESGAATRLTPEDSAAILQKVPGIRATSPNVTGRARVSHLNRNWSTQLLGAVEAYATMRDSLPAAGRFFTDQENRSRARVAVIGTTLVRELFGDRDPLGESIKVNKTSFEVIGTLPAKGANGFRDQDDIIVVPLFTAMHRLLGRAYVDSIDIEVAEPEGMDAAQDAILDLLHSRHHVPPTRADAFLVYNMAEIQAALLKTGQAMGVLLACIAAISLLVGGIGIMNIMLVSVTERTREIGLRKAIGARRADISLQFLAESVAVSAVGGVAGIALGWAITAALAAAAGWSASLSLPTVAVAFLFSASIGIVFGIYPARKAAALAPIEALRSD